MMMQITNATHENKLNFAKSKYAKNDKDYKVLKILQAWNQAREDQIIPCDYLVPRVGEAWRGRVGRPKAVTNILFIASRAEMRVPLSSITFSNWEM